jgi:hypothetical protein
MLTAAAQPPARTMSKSIVKIITSGCGATVLFVSKPICSAGKIPRGVERHVCGDHHAIHGHVLWLRCQQHFSIQSLICPPLKGILLEGTRQDHLSSAAASTCTLLPVPTANTSSAVVAAPTPPISNALAAILPRVLFANSESALTENRYWRRRYCDDQ